MTHQSINCPSARQRTGVLPAAGFLLALGLVTSAAASAADTIRFGTEAWPGVTAKTEVAEQLLNAADYPTERKQLNTPLMMNGVASGDLEAGLGGWYPVSKDMIDSMVDEGKVIKLTRNLQGALSGVAVPAYVHEAGVDSMDDLHKYADRFDHTIYGIESGSTWNTGVKQVIEAGQHDLDGWEVTPSNTSAMLAQVGRMIDREKWIAFYGWKPHWMNVKYDLYYPTAPDDSEIAHTESTVYTIVKPDFADKHPQVARFLKQYHVDPETQSRWIYESEYKERKVAEVAREWIAGHMDTVEDWLEGVKTADGDSAIAAVQSEYGD